MSLLTAIQIEEDYLKLIGDRDSKNKFNLKEKMEDQGFSLEQYHKEKDEFLFSQTPKRFKMSSLETLHADEQAIMDKGDSAFLVVAPAKKWVYVGEASALDEKDASYINIGHPCASIIATPKDLDLVCVVRHRRCLELYQSWLENELHRMGLSPKILGAEKALEGYSIYYFQMFFDGSERETVEKRWLK
jgi:hypothetical protein